MKHHGAELIDLLESGSSETDIPRIFWATETAVKEGVLRSYPVAIVTVVIPASADIKRVEGPGGCT